MTKMQLYVLMSGQYDEYDVRGVLRGPVGADFDTLQQEFYAAFEKPEKPLKTERYYRNLKEEREAESATWADYYDRMDGYRARLFAFSGTERETVTFVEWLCQTKGFKRVKASVESLWLEV